jgi:hypothetical protein
MLRDNLTGLIEPMRAARELAPLALFTEQQKSSDDRPQDALKIPAPKGLLYFTLNQDTLSFTTKLDKPASVMCGPSQLGSSCQVCAGAEANARPS